MSVCESVCMDGKGVCMCAHVLSLWTSVCALSRVTLQGTEDSGGWALLKENVLCRVSADSLAVPGVLLCFHAEFTLVEPSREHHHRTLVCR